MGKSAQLPLQTWLPDAMAGPTPVSALIHAATMVTAGVYLIARTHVLYSLAPPAQFAVAVVGAATLLIAGFSALTQWDLKRVLAYSTISQIGYMFLALGVGAWPAAIFHFMTHAFFKALLFLGAGIVIKALDDEHSIFRMGGLRTRLPVAFWTFLIAGCSLAGLPLITAGAFSKDWIVWGAWSAANGSAGLWIVALAGVLLTSLYTFRMIFLVFFGEAHSQVTKKPGYAMLIPCLVLAFLSIAGGYLKTPFARFLETVLPWTAKMAACSSHHRTRFRGHRRAWCFSSACTSPTSFSCASEPTQRHWHRARWAARCIASGFPIGEWIGSTTGCSCGRWSGSRALIKVILSTASIPALARVNEIAWRALSTHRDRKRCAGTRPASRPDPLSSSRWCCSYDPPLAHRHPPRRRRSRLDGSALASAAVPLDLARRRLRSTWFWRWTLRRAISGLADFSAGGRTTGLSKWIGVGSPSSAFTSTWGWMASAFCSFCSRSFWASYRCWFPGPKSRRPSASSTSICCGFSLESSASSSRSICFFFISPGS